MRQAVANCYAIGQRALAQAVRLQQFLGNLFTDFDIYALRLTNTYAVLVSLVLPKTFRYVRWEGFKGIHPKPFAAKTNAAWVVIPMFIGLP